MTRYTIPFAELGRHDVALVGGKNSSLGEMIANLAALGVTVPEGFATTADAYREFLAHDGLAERIRAELATLDVDDVGAPRRDRCAHPRLDPRDTLPRAPAAGDRRGLRLRCARAASRPPSPCARRRRPRTCRKPRSPASRKPCSTSAARDHVVQAVHEVFASLFNDRAIAYRVHQGFDHSLVALSAGVQHMVRSDLGASGVMFTLDTDSGFRDVVFITASCGLGETVVQGAVNPDEFYVYKPTLRAGHQPILRRTLGGKAIKMIYGAAGTAGQARRHGRRARGRPRCASASPTTTCCELSRQALTIEEHYGCPMDIEWGKDGETGKLYILQARPETVQSRTGRTLQRYTLKGKGTGAGQGPQHRPAHRRRPGPRHPQRARRWPASSPATCWSPT